MEAIATQPGLATVMYLLASSDKWPDVALALEILLEVGIIQLLERSCHQQVT